VQNTQVIQTQIAQSQRPSRPWWEKFIALVAVVNLLLALFNLTYVPLRDYYLYQFPQLVQVYDPVKGIEPHPVTQQYLQTVDQLESAFYDPRKDPADLADVLAQLREQSEEILDDNPFSVAGKFSTFARIQRVIRQHMGTDRPEPAFMEFWSLSHLEQVGWESELSFFDTYLRPAIASNYFRNVDDFGQYIDEFWRVDIFFIAFFAVEYLIRSFVNSLRYPEVNLLDAMLRRWYDVFMILPFWRWLRIISVGVKVHTSKLIDLEWVISQITYEPAAYLSDRVSQFVLVRLINQAKDSVSTGEFLQSVVTDESRISVNDVNEVEAIIDHLLELTIYKVLPQVQPDLEALLHHSLRRSFQDSNFYRSLQRLPGVSDLPDELIENLSNQLADASVEVLASSYADDEGRKLFDQLSSEFSQALRMELQNEATRGELESLLSDLLEEIKLNYVTQSRKSDPTQTMEEVEQINQRQNASDLQNMQ
jgi:hypothetical protein